MCDRVLCEIWEFENIVSQLLLHSIYKPIKDREKRMIKYLTFKSTISHTTLCIVANSIFAFLCGRHQLGQVANWSAALCSIDDFAASSRGGGVIFVFKLLPKSTTTQQCTNSRFESWCSYPNLKNSVKGLNFQFLAERSFDEINLLRERTDRN